MKNQPTSSERCPPTGPPGSGAGNGRVPPGPVPILAEGRGWVVINKPSGLLSVPGRGAETDPAKADCVAARIREMFPEATGPITPHRLDMDTSGVMVVALNAGAHRAISVQFQDRLTSKRYIALVEGVQPGGAPRGPDGEDWGVVDLALRLDINNRPYRIHDPKRGQFAVTHWRVIGEQTVAHPVTGAAQPVSRIEYRPLTGRSHQLRVHSALPREIGGLGAPIMGDHLYGSEDNAPRMMLHACSLAFKDPMTNRLTYTEAPAPF